MTHHVPRLDPRSVRRPGGRPRLAAMAAWVAVHAVAAVAAAAPSATAVAGGPDPAALARAAVAADLHEDPQWIRLGHWRRQRLDGWLSEIDGRVFFLAPGGKTDPRAELAATVRALYRPPAAAATAATEHALCRFPARAMWLQGKLAAHGARLPRVDCPGLERFWERAGSGPVHLVFSSYYINDPASAFGHTLLRFEGDRSANRLLDRAVNYSAQTSGENPIHYAILGMSGGYVGRFQMLRYYYKVREYNDFESRDLWSYELDLGPAQRAMLVAHLWELGPAPIDYFYLTENCSYQLLAALEVARPDVELVERLGKPVAPAETVQAVMAAPGLVREIHYRPSLVSRFQARLAAVPADHRGRVAELSRDPGAPLPAAMAVTERARVLDAAADLVDLRYATELIYEPGGEGAQRRQGLLVRRAKLGVTSPPPAVPVPESKAPHRGHGRWLVSAGAGWRSDLGPVGLVSGRMALHDLTDPPGGYPELMGMRFFQLDLSVSDVGNHVAVEQFDAIRIRGLAPWSRFQLNPSWAVDLGGVRLRADGCTSCFVGRVRGAGGLTLAGWDNRAGVWAMGSVLGLVGRELTRWDPDLPRARAGIGVSGGVRLRLPGPLILVGEGSWHALPYQEPDQLWHARGELRWTPTTRFALGAEADAQSASVLVGGRGYVYF